MNNLAKIILFGDSITAGWSEEGISDELTRRVAQAFPEDNVINAGIPGDTTEDALKRIEEHVLKHNPDIVTLFFGANDVATHRLVTRQKYIANMDKLISDIGREKVIVFGTAHTVQKVRKFDRPTARIEKYVASLEEFCQEGNLPFINVLNQMRALQREDDWIQPDGLHFSTYGYEQLAKLFNKGIQEKKEELGL